VSKRRIKSDRRKRREAVNKRRIKSDLEKLMFVLRDEGGSMSFSSARTEAEKIRRGGGLKLLQKARRRGLIIMNPDPHTGRKMGKRRWGKETDKDGKVTTIFQKIFHNAPTPQTVHFSEGGLEKITALADGK